MLCCIILPVRLTKKLIVRECCLTYNHRVGKEILAHYPSTRKPNSKEEQAVLKILNLRPNNKHVKELIENKFGKLITLKDIQNLKTKVRERTCKGMEDAQLLVDHLQEALRQDESARGGIVVDEDHTLELLHFQTGHMRKLFESFPEILLIDKTYNVNGQGMPLYCLMVEDGYGHGQVVYYAATAEEDAFHLQKIMQSFKEENSNWSLYMLSLLTKTSWNGKYLNKSFQMQRYCYVSGT